MANDETNKHGAKFINTALQALEGLEKELAQALKDHQVKDNRPFIDAYLNIGAHLRDARQALNRRLKEWLDADPKEFTKVMQENRKDIAALHRNLALAYQETNSASNLLERRLDEQFPGAYPADLGNSFTNADDLTNAFINIAALARNPQPPADPKEVRQRENEEVRRRAIFDQMAETPERKLQQAFMQIGGWLADAKAAANAILKSLPEKPQHRAP